MSLPEKEVAIDLLKKYVDVRQLDQPGLATNAESTDTIAGFLSWARNNATWLGKKIFRQQSDRDIINRIEAFVTQINGLDDFESYKRVIFDLGEYAYTAAENKFNSFQIAKLTQKESLLSRTLHAIRSYMVDATVNNKQSPFYNEFKKLLDELRDKRVECQKYIDSKRSEVLINIDDKVRERNGLIIKLAYLGDPSAISAVIDNTLLERLPRHTHGGIPVLQRSYHKQFYEKELKIVKSDTFEEYCEKVAREKHAKAEAAATSAAPYAGLFSEQANGGADAPQNDNTQPDAADDLRRSTGSLRASQ